MAASSDQEAAAKQDAARSDRERRSHYQKLPFELKHFLREPGRLIFTLPYQVLREHPRRGRPLPAGYDVATDVPSANRAVCYFGVHD